MLIGLPLLAPPSAGAQIARVTTYNYTSHTSGDFETFESISFAFGLGQTNIGYTNFSENLYTNGTFLASPDIIRMDGTNFTGWDTNSMLLSTDWSVQWSQTSSNLTNAPITGGTSYSGSASLPSFSGTYPFPYSTLSYDTASVGLALDTGGDPNNVQTRIYTLKIEAVQRNTPVPSADITVGGVACDADGKVDLAFADCSTGNNISAVFTAAQSNVWYNVTVVGVARPQIFRVENSFVINSDENGTVTNIVSNTNRITDAVKNATVGEQIILLCKMGYEDGSPYMNAAVTNWSWSISGLTLSNFVGTLTIGQDYDPYPKDQETCIFYWKDASTNTLILSCSSIVSGQLIPATTYFDVIKPSNPFSIVVGVAPNCDNLKGGYKLRWGGVVFNNIYKIGFIKTYATSENWTACQLITTTRKVMDNGAPWYGVSGSALDTKFPNDDVWDSPSMPCERDLTSLDDKFLTYLMYNPKTPGSIWVPVSVSESFGWSGTATRDTNNDTWSGAPIYFPNDRAIVITNTTSYPIWNKRFPNLQPQDNP